MENDKDMKRVLVIIPCRECMGEGESSGLDVCAETGRVVRRVIKCSSCGGDGYTEEETNKYIAEFNGYEIIGEYDD